MTATQAPKTRIIAAFAAIYIIWGSTYLAIKFAIATMPPFAMAATRFLVAGTLLYLWSIASSKIRPRPIHWLHAIIIGVLMLGVGNAAVVWSELRVPSGIASLIVAIVPLWVVLLDWLRPGGERPTGMVLIGVVVGFAGMSMLVGPSALGVGDIDLPAIMVLVIGSLAWSIGTVFGRSAVVPGYPPLTSAMQLIGGGVSLAVLSVFAGESSRVAAGHFSWQSGAALAYLIVAGSIVAFSAYSWLMRVAQPARIATYAYVNPVVAMLLGWMFADEQLTARTLGAAAVILAGVVLITTARGRDPRFRTCFQSSMRRKKTA